MITDEAAHSSQKAQNGRPMTKIFIYGTLKQGQCRAHAMQHQNFLGHVQTQPLYCLYDLGEYPALTDQKGTPKSIHGELWEITDTCLAQLDEIEEVGTLYERKPIQIIGHPDKTILAYFYLHPDELTQDTGHTWP